MNSPNAEESRIRQRVAEAIAVAGGVTKTSKSTGVPPGTLEKYAAQTSTASFMNAVKIASVAGVSLDEMAFGETDLVAKQEMRGLEQRLRAIPWLPTPSGEDLIRLPFYENVRASAGPGAVTVSEQFDSVVAFARSFLREHGAIPDRCSVIRARGDSMTPTIPDGSILVVDHSQTDASNGCITVISVGDDLLVKRVRRRLDGLIDLISDNPAYPPETIGRDAVQQLRIIGRVIYFCRVP